MQADKRSALPNKKYRSEQIDETLRKLHTAVAGIKASVVVNRDGLLVATYPPSTEESSPQVAAMSATLYSLAERTLKRLEQGELERLMMESEMGVMIIYPAGRATLAVLVDKDAQLGRVLFGARITAQEVTEVLDG